MLNSTQTPKQAKLLTKPELLKLAYNAGFQAALNNIPHEKLAMPAALRVLLGATGAGLVGAKAGLLLGEEPSGSLWGVIQPNEANYKYTYMGNAMKWALPAAVLGGLGGYAAPAIVKAMGKLTGQGSGLPAVLEGKPI